MDAIRARTDARAGEHAHPGGDLETEEPYKLETVHAATKDAMKQLQLSVLEGKSEKDALSATLVARDASDKWVTIQLKALGEQMTKLSIRIGTFGDQTKSHMIYNRIRENLKATVAAAALPAQTPPEPSGPQPVGEPAADPPVPPTPVQEVPAPPGPEQPAAAPPAQTAAAPPAPQ